MCNLHESSSQAVDTEASPFGRGPTLNSTGTIPDVKAFGNTLVQHNVLSKAPASGIFSLLVHC